MKATNDAIEIGASKVPAIVLGETPFQTNEEIRQLLLNAKKGILTDGPKIYSDAIDRGNYLEDGIAQWAYHKLQALCNPDVQINLDFDKDARRKPEEKMGASLDGVLEVEGGELTIPNPNGKDLIVTSFGCLEIKTDGHDDGPPRPDQVIQLQTQMYCSDFHWGVIAKLGPKFKFNLYPYPRDEKLINIIREKVKDLWHKVDNDIPYPEIVKPKPTVIDLNQHEMKSQLVQMITDWQQCSQEKTKWANLQDELEDTIKAIMEEVGAEYAELANFKINYPVVTRKAQPEKITLAKPATTYRRFTMEIINE